MAIDFEAIFAEPFDPCAAYSALFPKFMEAKLGGNAQKIMFRDREIWFHKPDFQQWESVMNDLQRQCREKQGLRPRRFAITGGYRT